MKKLLLLPVTLLFYSCAGRIPSPPDIGGNPLAGYKSMSNPRSSVPVGAVWIQNSGPNGDSAESDNLQVDKGISSLSYTANSNPSLVLGLAEYFGLSANQTQDLVVTLKNIETTRVRDVFRLNVSPGQNILYEALKAESISFTIKSVAGANLGSNFEARGVPVTAKISGGNSTTVTIDGSGLYLAYRVMKFQHLDRTNHTILSDGEARDLRLLIPSYQVQADALGLHNCACDLALPEQTCIKDNPIKIAVTDPNGTAIGGTPPAKNVVHYIDADRNKTYPLWVRTEGELPTGTVFVARYMRLDLRPSIEDAGSGNSCMVRFPPIRAGSITEITYQMQPVPDPVATGW